MPMGCQATITRETARTCPINKKNITIELVKMLIKKNNFNQGVKMLIKRKTITDFKIFHNVSEVHDVLLLVIFRIIHERPKSFTEYGQMSRKILSMKIFIQPKMWGRQ